MGSFAPPGSDEVKTAASGRSSCGSNRSHSEASSPGTRFSSSEVSVRASSACPSSTPRPCSRSRRANSAPEASAPEASARAASGSAPAAVAPTASGFAAAGFARAAPVWAAAVPGGLESARSSAHAAASQARPAKSPNWRARSMRPTRYEAVRGSSSTASRYGSIAAARPYAGEPPPPSRTLSAHSRAQPTRTLTSMAGSRAARRYSAIAASRARASSSVTAFVARADPWWSRASPRSACPSGVAAYA
ncbi:hypothetical protein ACFQ51_35295 [Streptomyces kaempferi]